MACLGAARPRPVLEPRACPGPRGFGGAVAYPWQTPLRGSPRHQAHGTMPGHLETGWRPGAGGAEVTCSWDSGPGSPVRLGRSLACPLPRIAPNPYEYAPSPVTPSLSGIIADQLHVHRSRLEVLPGYPQATVRVRGVPPDRARSGHTAYGCRCSQTGIPFVLASRMVAVVPGLAPRKNATHPSAPKAIIWAFRR